MTNEYKKKDVWWWKIGIITISCEIFNMHSAQCVCIMHTLVGCEWLKWNAKFRSNFWLRLSFFLSENFKSKTNFCSIFCRSCQIQCFLHIVPAILSWKFQVSISQLFFAMGNRNIQNCRHSVQKALDLTTPAKNRTKICFRFEVFR